MVENNFDKAIELMKSIGLEIMEAKIVDEKLFSEFMPNEKGMAGAPEYGSDDALKGHRAAYLGVMIR